ncbi:MAG: SCP2 sterol-binding domain-containing protein [Acidimicrobiales bacterium]
MSDFLSDEWVQALDARFAQSDAGSSPNRLVVQYDIVDDPPFTYHVILDPDRDRAIVGPADEADVRFSMSRDIARQVSTAELSIEEAFITGRVDIEGDITALLEAHAAAGDA